MSYRLEVDPEDTRDDGSAGQPQGRRHRLWIVGTLVAMFLVAGLWTVYRLVSHAGPSGPVPVLHADARPTKVKPDQPGGMVIPNQNTYILNHERVVDPKVEQLLPPPESPLPQPAPPEPSPESTAAAPASPEPPATAAAPATELPSAPSAAAAAPAAVAPPMASPQPAPAPAVAAPKPPPAPAPVASAPHPPATAGKGYRIQIGAVRSAEAAKAEWERLRHQNHDLLGALGYSASRVDLGARGVFYRIQAGPIAERGTAERTCNELKKRHLGCLLVKP